MKTHQNRVFYLTVINPIGIASGMVLMAILPILPLVMKFKQRSI